ncbi:hypothetical protein DVA76_18555, partial [Acinetobacter baumannii]
KIWIHSLKDESINQIQMVTGDRLPCWRSHPLQQMDATFPAGFYQVGCSNMIQGCEPAQTGKLPVLD